MKSGVVTIRVPATTANIGPGFDTLGIALSLYNLVTVGIQPGRGVDLDGAQLSNASHRGAVAMIEDCAAAFFKTTRASRQGFKVRIDGSIPVARGLGSSVTVRLGVVAGLNEIFHGKLDRNQIFQVVSQLEGHPDNAAPAVFGGFTIAGSRGSEFVAIRKSLPSKLCFVALIPNFEVETKAARKLLPAEIPFKDGVHNINQVGMLIGSFLNSDYAQAGSFLDDRLHQTYRAKLIPGFYETLGVARKRGALGGWLSGSGSTLMAMAFPQDSESVASAMRKEFQKHGADCETLILKADNRGFVVR
jgi:homoserine kinase